jgi:hypothetical protein
MWELLKICHDTRQWCCLGSLECISTITCIAFQFLQWTCIVHVHAVAYPGIFFGCGLCQEFFSGWGGSRNAVEYRGQREQESGGGSPLVRGSTQFVNEWNPYSDYVVTDVYSTELGILLSFGKTSELGGGCWIPPPPLRYTTAYMLCVCVPRN